MPASSKTATSVPLGPSRPRLTKSDLLRFCKDFDSRERFRSCGVSSKIWWTFEEELVSAAAGGFAAAKYEATMELVKEACSELYKRRFAEDYSAAYSARHIYVYFMDRLRIYGVKDLRDEHEREVDDTFAGSMFGAKEREWLQEPLETLMLIRKIIEREPEQLTEDEVNLVLSFKLNPHGTADVATIRRQRVELAAVRAVLATYGELSEELKIVIGGEAGLQAQEKDLLEGSKSYHGMRVNTVKEYYSRYVQARELLTKEINGRLAELNAKERFRLERDHYLKDLKKATNS